MGEVVIAILLTSGMLKLYAIKLEGQGTQQSVTVWDLYQTHFEENGILTTFITERSDKKWGYLKFRVDLVVMGE